MSITEIQMNNFVLAVKAGLSVLKRPLPMTPVEWADANYYLPKESAYQEGRWETLPFQRAIMNAMGSDYIREVNVVKSARVGYSKMLLGVYAYFIEHKQRNTLIWFRRLFPVRLSVPVAAPPLNLHRDMSSRSMR